MYDDSEWQRKGATLTDGTARREYGLTRADIVRGIRARRLSYRDASIYGNPCFRLLRREVEAFVEEQQGRDYLNDRRAETELANINRQLSRLRKDLAALEKRKAELMASTPTESSIRRSANRKRHDGGDVGRPNKGAAGDGHHGGIR